MTPERALTIGLLCLLFLIALFVLLDVADNP
jgi:hypothetical protein